MPPTPPDDEGPSLVELYPHRISRDPEPVALDPEVNDREGEALAAATGEVLPAALDDCAGCLLDERGLHRHGCPVRDLPPTRPVEPHAVEYGTTDGHGWARCACGQWGAYVTGPASAAWAARDHGRHVRETAPRG